MGYVRGCIMSEKLLSLCIPTNGVAEWVFPVLDSIYEQKCDEKLFEIIVTDNGNNSDFEKGISSYVVQHRNLVYRKTAAVQFLNQIEAFQLAEGMFIKFVNHRTRLTKHSLEYLITFVKKYKEEKPVVFFANGNKRCSRAVTECTEFDQFVRELSYWSSWSGGIACWKEHFKKISNKEEFNGLFPHTDILFSERNRNKYIVDNTILMEEMPVGTISKGRYNLFYAFSVEYILIIANLLKDKSISVETFKQIKAENGEFLANLFCEYIIRKKECSYDLDGYIKFLNVFYSYHVIKKMAVKELFKRIYNKIFR